MARKTTDPQHTELTEVLTGLLERDEDVTARAVARLHSTVREASSVTRHPERRTLLEEFQKKQQELRSAVKRVVHSGTTAAAVKLQASTERVRELEGSEAARVASHVAMIHAMAELGGTAKLQLFYRSYAPIRDALAREGSLPTLSSNVASLRTAGATG